MTQYPEAALAREAGLDFGDPDVAPVGQEEVLEVFRSHVDRVRTLMFAAMADLAVR